MFSACCMPFWSLTLLTPSNMAMWWDGYHKRENREKLCKSTLLARCQPVFWLLLVPFKNKGWEREEKCRLQLVILFHIDNSTSIALSVKTEGKQKTSLVRMVLLSATQTQRPLNNVPWIPQGDLRYYLSWAPVITHTQTRVTYIYTNVHTSIPYTAHLSIRLLASWGQGPHLLPDYPYTLHIWMIKWLNFSSGFRNPELLFKEQSCSEKE